MVCDTKEIYDNRESEKWNKLQERRRFDEAMEG